MKESIQHNTINHYLQYMYIKLIQHVIFEGYHQCHGSIKRLVQRQNMVILQIKLTKYSKSRLWHGSDLISVIVFAVAV